MVLLLTVTTLAIFVGGGVYMMTRQKGLARALAADDATGGIWFHPGHMWASFQPDGLARIGIDRFLRGILGHYDDVILPSEGRSVKQGQVLLTVTRGGRQVHLVSPLDGVVCATDNALAKAPNIHYNGALLVIRPTRLKENMAKMLGALEAEGWFRSELGRFKDFITLRMGNLQEVGATLADGGIHTDGLVEKMDEGTLKAFTESFLR
ncbi:MAG: hypothetical protein IH576_03805 [Deltaproteobacteria bacterium]|nr:hypothetical protein [Deltaproteobacteria bacterium]